LFQRGAIRGRDDVVALRQPIDPCLQQIRGLRQHQARAARLRVGKRALDVVQEHRARRGRQDNIAGANER
jgi:hypothetical protein